MPELLAHLVGDYVLQNHLMANQKVKFLRIAVLHAVLYTLPFLLLTTNPLALLIICGTHAVIDRWRIAKYWVEFYGIGVFGTLPAMMFRQTGALVEPSENGVLITEIVDGDTGVLEYPDAPHFLRVWLLIIVDNTLHMCINHLVLTTLP